MTLFQAVSPPEFEWSKLDGQLLPATLPVAHIAVPQDISLQFPPQEALEELG